MIQFIQKAPLSQSQPLPFDIIFIDPPFTKQMADEVMKTLSVSQLFMPTTLIAIESAKKKVRLNYSPLICSDQRHFGDKVAELLSTAENGLGRIPIIPKTNPNTTQTVHFFLNTSHQFSIDFFRTPIDIWVF